MNDQEIYWMPINAGEFIALTAGLSISAIGCFTALLLYLVPHHRVPAKRATLATICKGAKWSDIAAALDLFDCDSDGYHHRWVDEAKAKRSSISDTRSKAARKRWGFQVKADGLFEKNS